ncbi:hypothetical protein GCM10022221_13420 [Actinocorallia aurea]
MTVLAVGATGVLFRWEPVRKAVLDLLDDRRDDLYATVLSLEATLLGFVVAILTITIGFAGSPRLEIIRRTRHWPALFAIYTRTMRWAACAALAALLALILDRDKSPNLWLTALLLVCVTFSVAAVARMLWVTEGIVRVVTATRPPPR